MRRLLSAGLLCWSVFAGSALADPPAAKPANEGSLRIVPDIEVRRKQFVDKPLTSNLASLTPGDRKALGHLVRAAEVLHRVYARQAWRENPAFAKGVARLSGPLAPAARQYYRIMASPWDKLKNDEPFLGANPRPPGAGFYPEDLTKAEFDAWVAAHPEQKSAFLSPTTVILRDPPGKLIAEGYSRQYRGELTTMAAELNTAARLTTDKTLAKFLQLRATALLDDDYYASDMAWMDLDGPVEVVIGPEETYTDGLFGYKAAFESFVCISQPAEAERLASYRQQLPLLERSLPIPDENKNLKRGATSPIRVVDVVFASGDARSGVQTIAFNLPNDERVREAKGSKKVLLKNMMQAKYEAILRPVADRVLPVADASKIDFDTYFHLILFHEMSHGLGPGRLSLNGRETEVRLELKDLYAAIEEAKADAVGAWDLYVLADRKAVPAAILPPLPWTYVAGLFRSARFGARDAHGLGVVIQASFLLSRGAIEVAPDGTFRPVPDKFRAGIEALAHELLMVEARGDYAGAQKLVRDFGTPPPAMAKRLESLRDIPVDVNPHYTLFENR